MAIPSWPMCRAIIQRGFAPPLSVCSSEGVQPPWWLSGNSLTGLPIVGWSLAGHTPWAVGKPFLSLNHPHPSHSSIAFLRPVPLSESVAHEKQQRGPVQTETKSSHCFRGMVVQDLPTLPVSWPTGEWRVLHSQLHSQIQHRIPRP